MYYNLHLWKLNIHFHFPRLWVYLIIAGGVAAVYHYSC